MSYLRVVSVICGALFAQTLGALAAESASPQNEASNLMFEAPQSGNSFTRFFTDAEWYVSYGTSKEYWGNSDIHVTQSSLGNNFTMSGVQGRDDGFAFNDLLHGDFVGGQYNIRIGRFINDARTIGIEFSIDHSKYNTVIGQVAPVSGVINGAPINGPVVLSQQFYSEVLHNGANHVMISGVYRMPLIGQVNDTGSVSALAKLGAGVMLPHTTDTILGLTNDVGPKTIGNAVGLTHGWWQLNGWTVGAEGALRFVVYKPVYLELSDKLAFARLLDLPAVKGTVSQSLWMNEVVISLGITLDESLFKRRS